MNKLTLTNNKFDPNGYWEAPIKMFEEFPSASGLPVLPGPEFLELFDQEGFVMTKLEQIFAENNGELITSHYSDQQCLRKPWIEQEGLVFEGTNLNHSLLFERKGFTGRALDRLKTWAEYNTQLYKLIKLKPKWGIDFSIDYTDKEGNVMEVLHYEHDEFSYESIETRRNQVEPFFLTKDWDDVAKQMLKRKNEWAHLDVFVQGFWKCNYLGIPKDNQKMISWET
jgi:hypothetical protein